MSRRDIALRQAFRFGVIVILSLLAYGLCRCTPLTPAEQAQVAADGVKLSTCAASAHLCKQANALSDAGVSECWDSYEACMVSHGYRDAGRP